jgi:hypothetical protein
MSKIDSVRLSNVLAALAKPKERVSSSANASTAPSKTAKQGRDVNVLRTRLQNRLRSLESGTEEFKQAAPIITVQEILRWEFGDRILERADFDFVAKRVTADMLGNEKLNSSIFKVIATLVSG